VPDVAAEIEEVPGVGELLATSATSLVRSSTASSVSGRASSWSMSDAISRRRACRVPGQDEGQELESHDLGEMGLGGGHPTSGPARV